MKVLVLSLVFVSQFSLAKTSIEFNTLIEQQAQSQNETHLALTKEVGPAPILEAAPADQNRIVFLNRQIKLEEVFSKKPDPKKHRRLGSSEKIEENDFERLDSELSGAR